MANYLENYGLGFFRESEDSIRGLMAHAAQEGKAITGYYGLPYINQHYGNVQIIIRLHHRQEDDAWEVTGMDTHSSGHSIWTVRLSGMNIDLKDKDRLSKRVMVTRPDGRGMAPVNIVNADVLPSYMEDDLVTMQMIAFPELIDLFADEDEYAAAQPELKNGKKIVMAEGTVMPTGFMKNHDVNNEDAEKDEHLDDLCLVRGTIKKALWGHFKFDNEEHNSFVRCFIDTEYGELEIVFDPYELPEEQRKKLQVGAIISTVCTLSGDVAIHEYETGIVRDEEHDLALLRSIFSGGDPERLRSVLADQAVYTAEYHGTTYVGADEIIERLQYVQEDHTEKYYAHPAVITSVDPGETDLPYAEGKRCLVLASGDPNKYESIAFIETNDDGNIIRITTSIEGRYRFQLDKNETGSPLEDIPVPESVSKLIVSRARWMGVVDDDMTDEELLASAPIPEMRDNIEQMLEAMPDASDTERANLIENLFGYLFAKSIEMEYMSHNTEVGKWLRVSYSPSDARAGRIETALGAEYLAKLEEAMETGKVFYKDFRFWREDMNGKETETERETLTTALTTVQKVGRSYSRKCLHWQ